MRRILLWFLLCCKRYLKKPSFLLLVCLLPAVCFLIRISEKDGLQQVNIAVCALGSGDAAEKQPGPGDTGNRPEPGDTAEKSPETEDAAEKQPKTGDAGETTEAEPGEEDLGTLLVRRLVGEELAEEDALFHFYICGTEEEVKAEVAARRAECGYVFGDDLRQRLREHDARQAVRVYCAPSTVLDRLAEEVIFGVLAEIYDRELFAEYIRESGVVPENGRETAGEAYDRWLSGGTVFHFEYCYLDSRTGEIGGREDRSVFPVRGLTAVTLFLIGLCSAVVLEQDEKNGLFLRLVPGERLGCRLAAALAPLACMAVSCLAALWAGGCIESWGRELAAMAVYLPAVLAYGFLLQAVFRSPRAVSCMIPFLVAAALVCCPVFLDLGRIVPELGFLGRLFPPFYYLKAF